MVPESVFLFFIISELYSVCMYSRDMPLVWMFFFALVSEQLCPEGVICIYYIILQCI